MRLYVSRWKNDYFSIHPYFQPIKSLETSEDWWARPCVSEIVADGKGKELLAGGKFVLRQSLEESTYAALVKAESQLVAELSKEIARKIVALVK